MLYTNSLKDIAVYVKANAILHGKWFGRVKVSNLWEIELSPDASGYKQYCWWLWKYYLQRSFRGNSENKRCLILLNDHYFIINKCFVELTEWTRTVNNVSKY